MRNRLIHLMLGILIIFSLVNCDSELEEDFTYANQIDFINSDTIPVEVYVNNEKATEFSSYLGSIHLNSGNYSLTIKQGSKVLNQIKLNLDIKNTENQFYRHIVNIGKNKSYALIDVKANYDDNSQYKLEAKYINQDLIKIKSQTYHLYLPQEGLPTVIFSEKGSTSDIFKLAEIPASIASLSDDEILKYVIKNW